MLMRIAGVPTAHPGSDGGEEICISSAKSLYNRALVLAFIFPCVFSAWTTRG